MSDKKIGHLESHSNSLGEINRILSREGAIDFLFPAIKEGGLSDNEIENLTQLFAEVKSVFELIHHNADRIDEECKMTSKHKFPIKYDTPKSILLSYTIIIRYFVEYLIVRKNGFYSPLFRSHVDYIKKNKILLNSLNSIDYAVKSQFNYISSDCTSDLLGDIVNELNEKVNSLESTINELSEIEKSIKIKHSDCSRIEEKVSGYENELERMYNKTSERVQAELVSREEKINELKKYLENMTSEYNFAGLTKAYSDFYKSKSLERWISLAILFLLAIVSVLPISAKLMGETSSKVTDVNIVHYVGFTALTIIGLYFFRVALQNYNSIKAELTQIKLRMNLCMFVDNYSDFSKNKDNREALEKFENIIFSNIQPNENNIPSTFDGLEQLASLIESVTKRNNR